MSDDFKGQWGAYAGQVEEALSDALSERHGVPSGFTEVVRYSALGGGKRIRPILCLAACDAAGGRGADALPAGCALELIHAYSLVHDDLPSMDDDDLRRGQPTVHRKYGEAVAVLAGDGLQAEAFRLVGDRRSWSSRVGAETQLQVVLEVAQAAGNAGMVGGQYIDIVARDRDLGLEGLRELHRLKTGALIRAAAVCGGLIAGASSSEIAALSVYGAAVGALFQLTDDLLDLIESRDAPMSAEKEEKEAAVNFAVILGEERLREEVQRELAVALGALQIFAPAGGFLRDFAHHIATREA